MSDPIQALLNECGRRGEKLQAQRDALLAAAKKIWELIESGQLVRDTSKDHESGWAIKQIPFVQALKEFDAAIAACKE